MRSGFLEFWGHRESATEANHGGRQWLEKSSEMINCSSAIGGCPHAGPRMCWNGHYAKHRSLSHSTNVYWVLIMRARHCLERQVCVVETRLSWSLWLQINVCCNVRWYSGLNCIPPEFICWSLNPECERFRREDLENGELSEKRAIRLSPNPIWCPQEKRNVATQRETRGHMRTENQVRTQPEGGHPWAKERSLRRNKTRQHLDLRLLPSRTVRRHISIIESTQSVVLCSSSPNKLKWELWRKIKQGMGWRIRGLWF